MFYKEQFVSQNVTFRKESMFLSDIKANEEEYLELARAHAEAK